MFVVDKLGQGQGERESWCRRHRDRREKAIYSSYDDISVRASKRSALGCPTFLKRSHSVAVSKENLLSGLIPNNSKSSKKKNFEEQFIPRARLVEKSLSREQRLSLQNHYPKLRNFSALGIERKNHSETCLNNIAYASLSNLRWQTTEYMSPYAKNITRNYSNFTSLNNLSPTNWNFNEFETSISYDENITLARKRVEESPPKPKTIRAPTPYYQLNPTATRNSQENLLDAQAKENKPEKYLNNFENLRNKSSEDRQNSLEIKNEKSIEIINEEPNKLSDKSDIYAEYTQESDNPSSIDFETNTNFDEIDLENDNINRNSPDKPDLPVKDYFRTYKILKSKEPESAVEIKDKKPKDVTRIKVESSSSDIEKKTHISEVIVDPKSNYTETEKAKEPLKPNFIINKKVSDNTTSKSDKNIHCLCEKFSSLPDISGNKYLQKVEKTDIKLRKLQTSPKMSKILENKFVVNIGRHLDISQKPETNKSDHMEPQSMNGICTVEKTNWASTKVKNDIKKENNIVENSNTKIKTSFKSTKIQDNKHINNIVDETSLKTETVFKTNNKKSENIKRKVIYATDEEIKQKLEHMRQYWSKIGINETKTQQSSCKIVDLQKKTDNSVVKNDKSPKIEQKNQKDINENGSDSVSIQNGLNSNKLEVDMSKSKIITTNGHINHNKPCQNSKPFQNGYNGKEKLQKSKTIADFGALKNQKNKPCLLKKIDENSNEIPYHPNNKFQSLDSSPTDSNNEDFVDGKKGTPSIKKQLFYNSLKNQKGFNQEELPNPETVRMTRQFFERRLRQDDKIKSQSIRSVSGSLCDLSDLEGTEQVSEDILEKIREHGSTVTYYGGKIVDQHLGEPVLTKVIMKEIEGIHKICKES